MDIARLGFEVKTGDLADAKAKLDQIVPAAQRAANATDKFNNAAAGITRNSKGAATGIMSFESATMRAAAGIGTATTGFPKLDAALQNIGKTSGTASSSLLGIGTAMGTIQSAAAGITGKFNLVSGATVQVASRMDILSARWSAFLDRLRNTTPAAQQATSSLNRLGAAANDNINRMQSTPGNIAAQFQDIGVTAAGGMDPYLIALQQGTQLSAGLQGGIGNLAAAFAQLLSPISLLTIAVVGLLAAWIQSVDWYSVAASALNMLADAMEVAAPYAAALGVALAVAFAPQIIGWITATAVAISVALYGAIVKATAAMIAFAIANPFSAVVLGVALAIAALVALDKAFGGTFSSATGTVRKAINYIVGGFVGGFKTIKATWHMLPSAIGDAAFGAVNYAIGAIEGLINKSINGINALLEGLPSWMGGGQKIGGVNLGRVDNPFAGALAAQNAIAWDIMGREQGKDWVGGFIDGAKGLGSWAADALRGLAAGIGPDAKKDKTKKAAGGSDALTEAQKQAEAFDKMRVSSEAYVRSKQAEMNALSLTAREAAALKHQTDLINQAIQQGIPIDAARAASIQQWAQAMADADMKLANAQGWKKLQDEMASATAEMDRQREQIGMTAEQTARYKWEVVWLNEALKGLTEATPAQIAALQEWARGAADAEVGMMKAKEQVDRTREALNFAKESFKGFISDLRSGVEQGKGFFESLADAASKALDKIIDKLVDMSIEAAFSMAGGSSGGGGGGGIGSFLSAIGSAFSSGSGFSRAARGDVITGRTFLNHASGKTMAGENGAEAIVPLKRGKDGSLGVAMNDNRGRGGNGATEPSVTVNNHYHINGSSTADMQREVRESADRTREQIRREIPQVVMQYQADGVIAA